MIYRVVETEALKNVEKYVENEYYNCPFLYTNLKKYGLSNPNSILYESCCEGKIQFVALLYYDCLHLFFHKDISYIDDYTNLIEKLKPRKLFVPLYSEMSLPELEGYNSKDVLVMAPHKYLDIDVSAVRRASLSDIPRIAAFMCTEWSDRYESVESLCHQLEERIVDNYGRTKYIESNGEIVACVSSYAELDDFAVCGGLLVSDSQRGKRLGSVMLKSIYEELDNEGKKPCGLIVEDYSRIFHEKNGFTIVGKVLQYNMCV